MTRRADTLYIPIDTTPKTGSTYCENYDLTFERPCDFVICIDGRDNSRVVVQERYEVLRAMILRRPRTGTPIWTPGRGHAGVSGHRA